MLAELKQALVTEWFAKGGAESSGIRETAGRVIGASDQVAGGRLDPFVRQAEQEYGALMKDLPMVKGLTTSMLPHAKQAVGEVMSGRLLEGDGPSGWALWTDADLRGEVLTSVVDGLSAGLPIPEAAKGAAGVLTKAGLSAASALLGDRNAQLPAAEDLPAADAATGSSGLGSFGPVAFQVSAEEIITVRELTRKRPSRVAVHEVLSRPCKLQFMGVGPWEMSFRIQLHPGFCSDPLGRIADLERIQADGEHHAFVLGGRNLGRFLLMDLSEDDRFLGKGGRLAGAALSLTLKEYS